MQGDHSTRDGGVNIDPLPSRLTSKDRENYAKQLQRMGTERVPYDGALSLYGLPMRVTSMRGKLVCVVTVGLVGTGCLARLLTRTREPW